MFRRILISLSVFCCISTFANAVHYIIDTDMGFDDWLAVAYLLKQPVVVDAITIDCEGETLCPEGAVNAARLTQLVGRHVPIAYGAINPKNAYNFPKSIRDFATNMAVPGFLNLPKNNDITSISAAQTIFNAVINAAKTHTHVVIISVGTAENSDDAWKLAIAQHQTALFRQGLAMIYKGGSAFGTLSHGRITNKNIPGNITIPTMIESDNTVAEWNIYADAPAMKDLIDANLPITFIPNNATDQVNMTKKSYLAFLEGAKPGSLRLFMANAMDMMVKNQGTWETVARNLDFWDTATTVAALDSNLVSKKITDVPVELSLQPGKNYAGIFVSPKSHHDVTVYYQLDKKLFYQVLMAGI
ncbi:MAG: nucleoside hydrolase [Coxiellaceae bacterium]|nr:nucleoside hydrolase [Coxiellaceae bacterium]